MSLELLRQKLGYCVEKIAEVMPSNYKLTLIARHVGQLDADICATSDDLLKVADVCTEMHRRVFDAAAAEQLKQGDARFMAQISAQCERLLPDGFCFVVVALPRGSEMRSVRCISNCTGDESVQLLKGFLKEVEENPEGLNKHVS